MAGAIPIPSPHSQRACRHCGAALTALQRMQGDACRSLDCQRRAVDERGRARRDAALGALMASGLPAAGGTSTPQALPVVWLDRHRAPLTRLSVARREAQRQHLQREAQQMAGTAAEPASPAPAPDASTQRGGQLCGFCAGRCCRFGARTFAFIRAPQLKRWLDAHPGSEAADAVDAYMDLLPPRHVEGSCVHHGREGCTLPREMRAETCNRFACEGLRQVETLNENGVQPVVAAMQHHWVLDRVVLLGETAVLPIRSRRRQRPPGAPD